MRCYPKNYFMTSAHHVEALCRAVQNALQKKRFRPTNCTTKTAPKLSLLAQYAALNGAAKSSFFLKHSDELFAQFKKGVK
jgi:hypothetical protein